MAEVRILFEISHRALCTATELSKCLLMDKCFKNIELGTAGDLKAALSLYKKLGFEIISLSENHQWRNMS